MNEVKIHLKVKNLVIFFLSLNGQIKIMFIALGIALFSFNNISAGMAFMMFEVTEVTETKISLRDEHGKEFAFIRDQKDVRAGDNAVVATDLQYKEYGTWAWNTERTAIIDIERKKE